MVFLTSHIIVIQEAVGQCMRYLWNQKISEERNKYINIDSLIKWGNLMTRGPFLERPGNLLGPKRNSLNYDPLAVKTRSFNMFQIKEKRQNNCKVSKHQTCSYWRYKEILSPEMFRDFREMGPWTEFLEAWFMPNFIYHHDNYGVNEN